MSYSLDDLITRNPALVVLVLRIFCYILLYKVKNILVGKVFMIVFFPVQVGSQRDIVRLSGCDNFDTLP